MSFADLLKNVGREGFGVVRPTYVPQKKTGGWQSHAEFLDGALGGSYNFDLREILRRGKEFQDAQGYTAVEEDIETPTGDLAAEGFVAGKVGETDEDSILARTMAQIADIQNRQYSKGRGGVKDVLKGLGLGALEGMSNADPRQGLAGMLGAATGGAAGLGIRSGIDSSADDRWQDQKKLRALYSDAAIQTKLADAAQGRKYRTAQIQGIANKKEIDEAKLAQREKEQDAKLALATLNYERLVRAEENKGQRAKDKYEVKNVDGYLYRAYTGDPNRELEAIIDPRTGKQAVNPADVAQEITFDDGTKAMVKGGQIAAGKFADGRQKRQQEFTAGENEKNREQRRQEFIINFQQKVADDARAFGNDVIKRQQWKAEQIQKIQKDTEIPEDVKVSMIESISKIP